MAKHAPLYYATYKGPEPVCFVGDGREQRGYTAGSCVQIGEADAGAIRKFVRRKDNRHEFDLERVPSAIIGSAEDNHPVDPTAALAHNERIAEHV